MTKVNNNQSTTAYTNARSRSVENTLLLCLFVIGLLGTIYFMKSTNNTPTPNEVVYVEAISK